MTYSNGLKSVVSTFIYEKFQKANRLKELAEWMTKWDNGGAK